MTKQWKEQITKLSYFLNKCACLLLPKKIKEVPEEN